MDLPLLYRRHVLETEDLVSTFIENELGRHDWMNNWPAYKSKYPNFLEKIRGYFHRLGEDVNPEEIAKFIDDMIVQRPGKWR